MQTDFNRLAHGVNALYFSPVPFTIIQDWCHGGNMNAPVYSWVKTGLSIQDHLARPMIPNIW
jgi:hypothetical protein